MQAGSLAHQPVDVMQERRLAASGFTMPRANLIAARFACEGHINLQALADSADAALQRHSALRASFHKADGEFFQQIQPERRAEIHFAHSISAGAAPTGGDPFYRKFDLHEGSFLRLRVTRTRPQAQSFCIEVVTDHFVADGFALQIILDDISCYYNCQVTGRAEDRPPAAQHFEYARWQRGELTAERIQQVQDAWATRLRLDRSHKASQAGERTAETMWNAPETTCSFRTDLPGYWADGLRKWARAAHVTQFMAAAAVYAWSLAKDGGSSDITFLTPMSGRSRARDLDLVGNLARTLPIRLKSDPHGGGSLAGYAEQARQSVAFALKYQDLPVNAIAAELSKRPGQYVDCPNAPFFALSNGFRLNLAGISTRELVIDSISDAMLPRSTEIKLSETAISIDTVYDPSRATLDTIRQLHASIASVDFGLPAARPDSPVNGDA